MRFDFNASTVAGARKYLINRSRQLLADGVTLLSIETFENWGVRAFFNLKGLIYQSIYVLNDFRGKGFLTNYAQKSSIPFLTIPDCDIEEYFSSKNIKYELAGVFTMTPEYRAISAFCGDGRAKRSDIFMMNHIDEGLAILADIDASEEAKLAFCVHPLFQDDKTLKETYVRLEEANTYSSISHNASVIVLALEYRHIANGYLANRTVNNIDEIYMGPLDEVRDMLIADKVQNYKDFLLYHAQTHPRRNELDAYFKNWLKKLEITEVQFQGWCDRLAIKCES